jgi:hypothetical protein
MSDVQFEEEPFSPRIPEIEDKPKKGLEGFIYKYSPLGLVGTRVAIILFITLALCTSFVLFMFANYNINITNNQDQQYLQERIVNTKVK